MPTTVKFNIQILPQDLLNLPIVLKIFLSLISVPSSGSFFYSSPDFFYSSSNGSLVHSRNLFKRRNHSLQINK